LRLDGTDPLTEEKSMRLLIAVHSRDLRRALFLALNGIERVAIVGSATTTVELLSLWRALVPGVVVVEAGLPGQPLEDLMSSVEGLRLDCRVLIVDPSIQHKDEITVGGLEVFSDVDDLVTAVPE
jgi:DNA-binding NarL/FixJ family response regulator